MAESAGAGPLILLLWTAYILPLPISLSLKVYRATSEQCVFLTNSAARMKRLLFHSGYECRVFFTSVE